MTNDEITELVKSSLINVDLWNEAKWRGVGFSGAPNEPPAVCLAFENEAAGRRVFDDLLRKIGGPRDPSGMLRVAIVEGPVPGEGDGYTVHIGPDRETAMARVMQSQQFEQATEPVLVPFISRLNRMPASFRLEAFKREAAGHSVWCICPTGLTTQPDFARRIYVKNVHFRRVEDITSPDDPDAVVVGLKPAHQDQA